MTVAVKPKMDTIQWRMFQIVRVMKGEGRTHLFIVFIDKTGAALYEYILNCLSEISK